MFLRLSKQLFLLLFLKKSVIFRMVKSFLIYLFYGTLIYYLMNCGFSVCIIGSMLSF